MSKLKPSQILFLKNQDKFYIYFNGISYVLSLVLILEIFTSYFYKGFGPSFLMGLFSFLVLFQYRKLKTSWLGYSLCAISIFNLIISKKELQLSFISSLWLIIPYLLLCMSVFLVNMKKYIFDSNKSSKEFKKLEFETKKRSLISLLVLFVTFAGICIFY